MSVVRSHCGRTGGTISRALMGWFGWWTALTGVDCRTADKSSMPCCSRRSIDVPYISELQSWYATIQKIVKNYPIGTFWCVCNVAISEASWSHIASVCQQARFAGGTVTGRHQKRKPPMVLSHVCAETLVLLCCTEAWNSLLNVALTDLPWYLWL